MANAGQEIRRLREEQGISQAELARRTDTVASAISRIEHGRTNPSVSTLEKLAEGLGAEVADFFPKAQPPLEMPMEVSEERRIRRTSAEKLEGEISRLKRHNERRQ